ncbi:MAG: hypothetical protein JWQ03_3099 [Variovorax sp.]|nr:hypothetical protein [Variovorax sp.]
MQLIWIDCHPQGQALINPEQVTHVSYVGNVTRIFFNGGKSLDVPHNLEQAKAAIEAPDE